MTKKSDSIFNSRLFWTIESIVGTTAFFLGTYITKLDYKKTETLLEDTISENKSLIEQNGKFKDSMTIRNRTEIVIKNKKLMPISKTHCSRNHPSRIDQRQPSMTPELTEP